VRAWASVTLVFATAEPTVGESARHNTSPLLSEVLLPHAPTVPTSGATGPLAQSYELLLPMRTKSPRWSTL